MTTPLTRRQLLASGIAYSLAAGLVLSPGWRTLLAQECAARPRYRIGACDWSLGMRQNLGAFDLAKEIGLDGVQVSFDDIATTTDLRLAAARAKYAEVSNNSGVEIASLGMCCLNHVPLATEDRAEEWVGQCIDVMTQMKQKIVLLAFFGQGDIKGRPDRQDKLIARLKRLAPKAEVAGVILGIESQLDAADHLRILDAVGSPNVQVYYDVCNMTAQKYEVPADIRKLKGRICQVHCKENGHLLGDGPVDFAGVKKALLDIDYDGWLVIEGATVRDRPLVECYQQNRKFLDSLFNA